MKDKKRIKQKIKKKHRKRSRSFSYHVRIGHMFNRKQFRLLLISSSLALLVGIFFGVIMLTLTKQENESFHSEIAQPTVEETISSEQTEQKATENITFYTLQLGVFADESNASSYIDSLQQENISIVHWKRDEMNYIISGVFSQDVLANEKVSMYEDKGLEVYVKKWEVFPRKDILTDEEKHFLNIFRSVWTSSLQSFENSKQLSIHEWEQFLEKNEKVPEQLQTFIQHIAKKIEQVKDDASNEEVIYQFFLDLIYAYESL